jgi:hypothetical protein
VTKKREPSKAKRSSPSAAKLFHDSKAQDKIWTLVAKEHLKMYVATSEKRQIENEMIFRRLNEKLIDGFDEQDTLHIADNNPQLIRDDNLPIQFTCECSDENCVERIAIKYSEYQEIHKNRKSFIVKLDHEVNLIEKVVQTENKYSVVKKNNSVKEPGDKLNETSINNS